MKAPSPKPPTNAWERRRVRGTLEGEAPEPGSPRRGECGDLARPEESAESASARRQGRNRLEDALGGDQRAAAG